MRFTFRPLPGLTVACTILFAILIGLGVWQLQRLHWKLGLIAMMNRNMHVAAVSLDAPGKIYEESETEYLHVAATGRFDNGKEAYVFATGPEGAPVFHVLVPFTLKDGRVYMVDRGIVPRDMKDPSTRPGGIVNRDTKIVGYWRWAQAPGTFTPPPDRAHRIWFSRDVIDIARADGVTLAQPALIEADAAPNPGGWPRGGQTVVDIRNEHLQYAITWFLMAAALFGVYLAYHASKGRLGLTSKD